MMNFEWVENFVFTVFKFSLQNSKE